MHIDRQSLVSDIVARWPRTATVFESYRIDFCCGGRVTVDEACRRQGVDPAAVHAAIDAAADAPDGVDAHALPTATLLEHIVARHHAYLRRVLPSVERMADKVAMVHGAKDARLLDLAVETRGLVARLAPHIDHEERVVFPALASGSPDRRIVDEELGAMRAEHVDVGACLERLRALTDGYRLPTWACAMVRALWGELEQIERDTHVHVHLENHVLLPRFAREADRC